MKSSRAHFLLVGSACSAFCLALLLSLGGYFRSVERGSTAVGTEKHLLSQLKIFHDRLKNSESPEEAKSALKLLEGIQGIGRESEGARELKQAYGPVLAVFAGRPREAETRYQLSKKRELMEGLVNAYRKEIPHGDIRVRAAYLNILFDTQYSLLSESDEAETVFLKRNRERFDGLKSIMGSAGDATLPARVNGVDSIFQSYERAFQQGVKWRAEKAEALAREEKALPGIAKSVYSGEDNGVDETRRTFLYICFLSLIVAAASILALYLGFKIVRVRSELRMEAFLTYLRAFGTERTDGQTQNAMQLLQDSADWAPVLADAKRAEENFLRSFHNLLAVPRSLRAPFLVVGKDKTLRYWNDSATTLFGLTEAQDWGLADLLRTDLVRAREGDAEALLEIIRNAFGALTEDRFELLLLQGGDWQPFELSLSPITSGPLAGGKIFFWREIRSEADRVDKSVALQLHRIRELAHMVTHQYAVDFTPAEGDVPAAREMIADLETLKRKTDEREILWKSEAQALIDQVNRQQEVLHRLSDELVEIRTGHNEALTLVRDVHGGDGHWHDEVCAMERDLERWAVNRKRLLGDLRQQAFVLEKARLFEQQLRSATTAVQSELDSYQGELERLNQFSEAARVHSVNLSFVRDPGYWEFAARSRAFSHELTRFIETARVLGEKVSTFLADHPGGALAAHLQGPGLDDSAVDGLVEEQERTATLLKRWKESGENLLEGGEKALALLQEADKKGAVASQLGETSILINQQTKGNLERWN